MSNQTITRCRHCGCYIDTRYGADPPGEHQDHAGTKNDPRAPGDWDDICDRCNYDKGLQGGPTQ